MLFHLVNQIDLGKHILSHRTQLAHVLADLGDNAHIARTRRNSAT